MTSPSSALKSQSGVLPLHKPVGLTSRQAIDVLETDLPDEKIGHAGTLDPLAEGVLPLMFNEATKLVSFLQTELKQYRVRARFDYRSESFDLGEPVESTPVESPPDRKKIKSILEGFEGTVQQTPPKYSAVNSDGKRLYRLNRGTKDITPEPREVYCDNIRIIDYDHPSITLTVTCGKGFYIRSLVRDLAQQLELPGGVVTALVRTTYGPFNLNGSAYLHETASWRKFFSPPRKAVESYPHVSCNNAEIRHLTNGGWIDRSEDIDSTAMAVDPEGIVHAILRPTTERGTSQWRPRRVLNRDKLGTLT